MTYPTGEDPWHYVLSPCHTTSNSRNKKGNEFESQSQRILGSPTSWPTGITLLGQLPSGSSRNLFLFPFLVPVHQDDR